MSLRRNDDILLGEYARMRTQSQGESKDQRTRFQAEEPYERGRWEDKWSEAVIELQNQHDVTGRGILVLKITCPGLGIVDSDGETTDTLFVRLPRGERLGDNCAKILRVASEWRGNRLPNALRVLFRRRRMHLNDHGPDVIPCADIVAEQYRRAPKIEKVCEDCGSKVLVHIAQKLCPECGNRKGLERREAGGDEESRSRAEYSRVESGDKQRKGAGRKRKVDA